MKQSPSLLLICCSPPIRLTSSSRSPLRPCPRDPLFTLALALLASPLRPPLRPCAPLYALAFELRSSPTPSRSPPCLYPLGPLFTRALELPFSPAPLHSLSALMRNHCIIVSKKQRKQCAQYKQAEHADKHGEGGCSPVRQTCSRDVECNFADVKHSSWNFSAKRYYSGWKS